MYKAVSTLRPKNFKTQLYFLRLGLPSTLIHHVNEAFQKRSSNRRDLKSPAFRFRMGQENTWKIELFENNRVAIIKRFSD